ncbi:MAG: Ig-like domain-containing protein, partial [Proteobacteria bacterium]|nr:Ig-like domain-containing protein [Pseudomonadota bacterium]
MPKLRVLIAALALSLPVLAAAEAPQAMPAADATQVDRVLEPGWHFATASQAQAAARGALQLLTPVGTPVAGIVKVTGATAVFEPAAPLAGCTRYTLQFLSAPAQRSLRSSFTTVCSTWSEPVEIDDAHTAHQVDRPASGAEVVAGKGGHAVAAWFQSNGQRNAIFASRYASQTDFWSAPRTIDLSGGGAADVPALVADGQGRVTAAWFQALGGRTAIFACRLDVGGGCPAPVRLDDPGVGGNATNPQLAADDLGNVVAVWQQPDGHHTAIFAARWTQAQQRWLPAQALDRSPSNAYDVVIASMGGGGFVGAWEQGKRRHESIWASTLRSPTA